MDHAAATHPLILHYPTSVPHCGALGQEVVAVESGWVRVRQPYAEHLLGDIERGWIHTSVQLTLVDSAFGAAVLSAFDTPEPIATLDLRMDYHRPAVAGQDLFVDARVERVAAQIVFVSGTVWQERPERPTAVARAAFMRVAHGKAVVGQEQGQ